MAETYPIAPPAASREFENVNRFKKLKHEHQSEPEAVPFPLPEAS